MQIGTSPRYRPIQSQRLVVGIYSIHSYRQKANMIQHLGKEARGISTSRETKEVYVVARSIIPHQELHMSTDVRRDLRTQSVAWNLTLYPAITCRSKDVPISDQRLFVGCWNLPTDGTVLCLRIPRFEPIQSARATHRATGFGDICANTGLV
jgi:hypothetical protein